MDIFNYRICHISLNCNKRSKIYINIFCFSYYNLEFFQTFSTVCSISWIQ